MILKKGFGQAAVVLLIGGLAASPGCASAAGRDGDWGWERSDDRIVGEVVSVDTRRDQIRVALTRGGTRTIRYDRRTEVVERGRRIPVTLLRRGDDVRIRVDYDRYGRAWAERIDVYGSRWSSRDDDRWYFGRSGRLDGVVRAVELRRGYFTLEPSRGRIIVIRVPGDLRRDDENRLRRLRRGDRVTVEVRHIGSNEVRLIRFR